MQLEEGEQPAHLIDGERGERPRTAILRWMCAPSDPCQENSVALSRGNARKPRYRIVYGPTKHALIPQMHGGWGGFRVHTAHGVWGWLRVTGVGRVQGTAHRVWGGFRVTGVGKVQGAAFSVWGLRRERERARARERERERERGRKGERDGKGMWW